MKLWIGRRIATDTRDLTTQAAAAVDRQVARYAHSLTLGRLTKVVQAAIIEADPDFAWQREQSRRRGRGVWLHPADEVGTVCGSFAAAGPDASRFDAGLDRAADALGLLGDTDPNKCAAPAPSASWATRSRPWTCSPRRRPRPEDVMPPTSRTT